MAKKIQFDLTEVERLASIGCTEEQIAQSLGVSRQTIARRKRDDDTFVTAYKAGRNSCIVTVKNSMYESATHPDKPNVLAQKTLLERVEGPAQVEIQGSLDVNNNHNIDQAMALLVKAGVDVDSL
tara:strand:+ start:112 stop:486 length:375 start_codon:yes stop_codon:yes gene_type:complete